MSVFSLKSILSSHFIKNAGIMFSGNILASILLFAASPILTRIYAPAHFGIFKSIQIWGSALSIFVCLRYNLAIVLTADEKDRYNLAAGTILSIFILTGLMSMLLLPFQNLIVTILNFQDYKNYILFLPLFIIGFSLKELFEYFHTSLKDFKTISTSIILFQLITVCIQILGGLIFPDSPFFLVTGRLTALCLIVYFFLISIDKFKSKLLSNISISKMVHIASINKQFPLYAMPTGLLNLIARNLPIFLFGALFGQQVIGWYALADLVLKKPVQILSQSISNVFFQKMAELSSREVELYSNFKKASVVLAGIGVLPFGLLTLWGKDIFTFAFGNQWTEAGVYAQILAPWLFLTLIKSPADQIIFTKQKLKLNLLFNIAYIIINAGLTYLTFSATASDRYCIAVFSGIGFVFYACFILYCFYITRIDYMRAAHR